MRKFQIIKDTWGKLNSTKQSYEIQQNERVFLENNAIIETQDTIYDRGSGHVEMWIKVNIFADHLQEIKAIASPTSSNDYQLIKELKALLFLT